MGFCSSKGCQNLSLKAFEECSVKYFETKYLAAKITPGLRRSGVFRIEARNGAADFHSSTEGGAFCDGDRHRKVL